MKPDFSRIFGEEPEPTPTPGWENSTAAMQTSLETAYHVALAEGRHMDALAIRGEQEA